MKNLLLSLFIALQSCQPSYAADVKIGALPLGSANLTGVNDSFPYVDVGTGVTRRLQLSKLLFLPSMQSTFAPLISPTFSGTVTAGAFAGPLTGNVTGNVSGSALSFTGSLVGDVTGTQGATVVSTVGTSSAANVHAAELLANAAASANTVSTIVKRDGSGNFSAGTISASLTGNASGNTTYAPNQYGVVLSGAANVMSVLAPNASTAYPLISGGASTNPAWGVLGPLGGGTGLSSYVLGDVPYASATNVLSSLAGNITTTKKLLSQTGSGAVSAAPTWAILVSGDIPNNAADTTGTATNATNIGTTVASTNASFFPAFLASSSSGNQAARMSTGFSVNPSTNAVTATTFIGAVTGTASGNTTYTANQYGVVLSGSGNTMSVLAPDASTTKILKSGGASANPSWSALSAVFTSPTIQNLTSGTGATYTLPAGVLYIRVRAVAGGGGGSGGGSGGGTGTTGGSTTFGSSMIDCTGGASAGQGGPAAVGGVCTLGTGPIGTAMRGAPTNGIVASPAGQGAQGGVGGNGPWGGGGGGSWPTSTGSAGATNSGSGGGGGGSPANSVSGQGGSSGGYADAIIRSPAATYTYTIGGGGSGGAAGTGGGAGGAGGTGYIEVTEYYQ